MADPTCNATTLVTDAACYQCLSPLQQKAAIIYLNMLELNALGGTDYETDFPTTLVDDTNDVAQRFTPAQILTAQVAIAAQNATAAGATVPASVDDWMTFINQILNFPNEEIVALLLQCQLGAHKAYPQ